MSVRQIRLSEPFEGAMHGHDFDQRLEHRIGVAVIARLMGVWNDQDVARIDLGVERLVEALQGRVLER